MRNTKIKCYNMPFLDYVPMGIFIVNKGFNVIFWNVCMENWTGISRGFILDKSILDLLPQTNEENHESDIESLFKGEDPKMFLLQLQEYFSKLCLPNRQIRIKHTIVKISASDENDSPHALFTIEDITEMNLHIESLKKIHKQAIKDIADAMDLIQIDVDSSYWNYKAELLFGIETERAIGEGTGQKLNTAYEAVFGKFGGVIDFEKTPGQNTYVFIRKAA